MTNSILEEGLGEDTPWDPNAEVVQAHYSSITMHRKCPEAWYFRYGLKLSKPELGPAPYLHFGTWYGLWRTAEALERGRAAESLVFVDKRMRTMEGDTFDQSTLTTADVLEAAQAWWDSQVKGNAVSEVEDAWNDALGGTLIQRLEATTTRWRDEFGEAAKNEEPLGLEVFWKRELPRSWDDVREPGDPDSISLPKVMLIGFIDELYRDKNRGMVVVRDNKTSSRMETMSAFTDMTDSQLSLYAWGITPMLKAHGVESPRAMGFDRILSKATAKPSLNMDGTISKKSWVWDLRTYLDFVASRPEYPGRAKDGSGSGVYELEAEVVRRLSQEQWKAQFIQRTLTPISKPMIVAHLRAASDSVIDIWRTQRRAARTFEAARNLTKDNCRWCDYASLCRARMFGGTGEDVTYDLREHGIVGANGPLLIGSQTYTSGE